MFEAYCIVGIGFRGIFEKLDSLLPWYVWAILWIAPTVIWKVKRIAEERRPWNCPGCGFENPGRTGTCRNCGTINYVRSWSCEVCEAQNPFDAVVCQNCSAPPTELSEDPLEFLE